MKELHLDDNALRSILRSQADDELRDYQARGRRFAKLSDDELINRAMQAFRSAPHPDITDLTAELNHRNLTLPESFWEEMKQKIDAAQKDPAHMERVTEHVVDLLVEYMERKLN
jgi:hypothetical protein